MDDLHVRARRAYELARLRRALPWAVPALLLAVLAHLSGSSSALPLGVLLAAGVVALRWAGRDLGRAVPGGLAAGALVVAVVYGWAQGGSCGPECAQACAVLAAGSGAAAAGVLGLGSPAGAPRTQHAAALGIASLAAAMSCWALGLPGALAVGVLWVATTPRLLRPAVA